MPESEDFTSIFDHQSTIKQSEKFANLYKPPITLGSQNNANINDHNLATFTSAVSSPGLGIVRFNKTPQTLYEYEKTNKINNMKLEEQEKVKNNKSFIKKEIVKSEPPNTGAPETSSFNFDHMASTPTTRGIPPSVSHPLIA